MSPPRSAHRHTLTDTASPVPHDEDRMAASPRGDGAVLRCLPVGERQGLQVPGRLQLRRLQLRHRRLLGRVPGAAGAVRHDLLRRPGRPRLRRPPHHRLHRHAAMGLPLLSPYLQSIGSDYRHGANFATLASTALLPNTSLFVTGISPFSLGIQLNQMKEFRNRVLATNGGNGQLPPPDIFGNALYTIDIGQNDFTSNLGSLGVEGVKQSLPSDLYNIGARSFMVFNMAPIGCYPAFLTELPHNSNDLDEFGCMKSYNSGVAYYNELLNNSLAEVRKKLQDASVVYVDKHTVTLELFQHPNAHGLKFGTRACCGYGGGTYNFNQNVYCGNSKVVNGKTATAGACEDPQNYVSWDGIHATEAANMKIASAVMSGSYSYPPFDHSKLCGP
ncbi:hypothetical protein U9M48_029675 [Paspalum notatum var. saurae]|uniref:GDSL esterase/lipase n=1 Tax=Paspalum notatum var. saurae TaxID=547442 RepID=A0AAQ3TYD6_PASNO